MVASGGQQLEGGGWSLGLGGLPYDIDGCVFVSPIPYRHSSKIEKSEERGWKRSTQSCEEQSAQIYEVAPLDGRWCNCGSLILKPTAGNDKNIHKATKSNKNNKENRSCYFSAHQPRSLLSLLACFCSCFHPLKYLPSACFSFL